MKTPKPESEITGKNWKDEPINESLFFKFDGCCISFYKELITGLTKIYGTMDNISYMQMNCPKCMKLLKIK
jgi:hypothetical protein